jgi:hypothetical protein
MVTVHGVGSFERWYVRLLFIVKPQLIDIAF